MQQRQDRLVEWFRELREPLLRFLCTRRGMAAADLDDVAQEVFLRLLRFDRAELVEQPKAYLFKMAANVASEWRMRGHQRWPHDSEWLADIASDESVDSQLQLKSRSDAIARALEPLSPRVRTMLQLHFDEGLTYAQIATRMQMTHRMVKRDMIRAYASLRDALEDEFAEFPAKRSHGESGEAP